MVRLSQQQRPWLHSPVRLQPAPDKSSLGKQSEDSPTEVKTNGTCPHLTAWHSRGAYNRQLCQSICTYRPHDAPCSNDRVAASCVINDIAIFYL